MSIQCRTFSTQRPCGDSNCERPDCNPGPVVSVAEHVMDIVTETLVPFRVVYGRRQYGDRSWSEPVVSFYDRRYPGHSITHFTPHGQFVSDYTLDAMLMRQGYGLNLGEDPSWSIDGTTMHQVKSWLTQLAFTLGV